MCVCVCKKNRKYEKKRKEVGEIEKYGERKEMIVKQAEQSLNEKWEREREGEIN